MKKKLSFEEKRQGHRIQVEKNFSELVNSVLQASTPNFYKKRHEVYFNAIEIFFRSFLYEGMTDEESFFESIKFIIATPFYFSLEPKKKEKYLNILAKTLIKILYK